MKSQSGKPTHMVNDVPYKKNGLYQMVVEIPAGTNEKWQTDPEAGTFYHDQKDGKPRIINFLAYPFNYGIIPQTILARDKGGDGDPTDIITLTVGHPRGSILPARVIGAIKLSERGELDTKVIAVVPGAAFDDVQELSDLLMQYPGTVEIIRLWFEGYKGPGSFLFMGYMGKAETEAWIEETHADWQRLMSM